MSFVTTLPEAMTTAAGSLAAVESALTAQNAAAAAPTTGVVPAAADEVSALQATQFAAYGTLYQQISAQAAAIQQMFVHTLRTSADSYDATEAANSVAAAPSAGAGLSAGASAAPAADPSFGLAGALSNSGILAAMQAGTIGSAASEFTGLGKGYITSPSGVTSGSIGAIDALLFSQTSPAGAAATPAAPATLVSAGVGQATPIGGLSVPPSWAGQAAPAASAAPATLAGAGWTGPASPSAPMAAMPAGVPAMAAAGGGAGIGSFGRPRYGVKPKVMPDPTVG